jgi:hypothetical protein
MDSRAIRLSDTFINILISLPENGMGFQIVKIFLKDGTILSQHKVINSEWLMLEENENISNNDIENIELEKV